MYHLQESQQPGKKNAVKEYRRSDPIRCLIRWRGGTGPLCLCIYRTVSPRYLCYMYRAKHMNEIYAAEIYSQSQICFGGRMEMALFKSRSSKLHGNLILPWIWNCLDNNYALLLYRVRLSGWLGLSSLGIYARSADKFSLKNLNALTINSNNNNKN